MEQVREWHTTLTEKERKLHALASIMLKKELHATMNVKDKDNGSYFPDKCHAFRSWLKAKEIKK